MTRGPPKPLANGTKRISLWNALTRRARVDHPRTVVLVIKPAPKAGRGYVGDKLIVTSRQS
jgi:hypothetical protein